MHVANPSFTVIVKDPIVIPEVAVPVGDTGLASECDDNWVILRSGNTTLPLTTK